MTKLSLKKTWEETLRMWKWIDEQIAVNPELIVTRLKYEWLTKEGYKKRVMNGCFLCEYASNHMEFCELMCKNCPATLVEETFYCNNSAYNWANQPRQFYKKLVELNELRLSKKGKKK